MMFGTWLAVAYAVPRQWLPTVCAKTSWRPKPTTRAITVMPPMSAAARPIPRLTCRSGPGSVTEVGGPVTALGGVAGSRQALGGVAGSRQALGGVGGSRRGGGGGGGGGRGGGGGGGGGQWAGWGGRGRHWAGWRGRGQHRRGRG